MRVIVTGGRNYRDWGTFVEVMDGIHDDTPISVVVHGGATGADKMADDWAAHHHITVERHPADWKIGPRAGPERNNRMAEAGANLLVVFPGGKGTSNMRYHALKRGIPIHDVTP